MMKICLAARWCRLACSAVVAVISLCFVSIGLAHPLGNFTVNHYARLTVSPEQVNIRYVVDMAEIATLQEFQAIKSRPEGFPARDELDAYVKRIASEYSTGLVLVIDGERVGLRVEEEQIALRPGEGGLTTLRVACNYSVKLADHPAGEARLMRFEDLNHAHRIGWREIVVVPANGASVFDSSAYSNSITDELNAYPEDLLLAPLNERVATWSVSTGAMPVGAKPLLTRAGKPFVIQRDRFAELISRQELTPMFALFALLLAVGLGAVHALSPGHGKTIVGAYLVGAKGTAKHAAFLGLTVTITHTSSVIALGLITLFASRYILPEKLYPLLSLVSGALVLSIGLRLLVKRLRSALGWGEVVHHHPHSHEGHEHAHDGQTHSHLPPDKITWRNLLALGISGGLVPCPSALVVMLAAIALNRVAFGLLLIVAFSVGLAGVLTAIGLAFVYAGKMLKSDALKKGWLGLAARTLPLFSALAIAVIGGAIMWQAITQTGLDFKALLTMAEPTHSLSAVSTLTLGLILGLKHAIEADHLAAVTTIVTERKSLWSSTLVGGLWGIGHTMPILAVGLIVILLRIEIKDYVGLSLEFCVGLMLIALGVNALWKLSRSNQLHLHAHKHGGHLHTHPHFHAKDNEIAQSHHGFKLNLRPLLVGIMHGLAGSAALVPLVVAEIRSPLLGLFYMLIFGLGSIGGMMLMSLLVGLPLHLTAARFTRFNMALRGAAGLGSLGFGLFMVYQIGLSYPVSQ